MESSSCSINAVAEGVNTEVKREIDCYVSSNGKMGVSVAIDDRSRKYDSISIEDSSKNNTSSSSRPKSKHKEGFGYKEVGSSLLVGKVFQSDDDAYNCYNRYGFSHGFGVRKSKTRERSDGSMCSREYVCAAEGFKNDKVLSATKKSYNKVDIRAGCKAMIRCSVDKEGLHTVVLHEMQHSHEMVPEGKRHLIRSHRKVIQEMYYKEAMSSRGVVRTDENNNSASTSITKAAVTNSDWVTQMSNKFNRLIITCESNAAARHLVELAYLEMKKKVEKLVGSIEDLELPNDVAKPRPQFVVNDDSLLTVKDPISQRPKGESNQGPNSIVKKEDSQDNQVKGEKRKREDAETTITSKAQPSVQAEDLPAIGGSFVQSTDVDSSRSVCGTDDYFGVSIIRDMETMQSKT